MRPRLEPPCIVTDMSHDDYVADPCEIPSLSASVAHTLCSYSPYHGYLQHPRFGGANQKPTAAMDFGSIVHALVLGQASTVECIPRHSLRSKQARLSRDSARLNGKVPVLPAIALRAAQISTAVLLQLQRRGVALDGQSEATVLWEEQGSPGMAPVVCRGRMDHWSERQATIYDLKTMECARPDAVSRHMVAFGCHIQAAAYIRAMEQVMPELAGRIKFVFLFVELGSVHLESLTRGEIVVIPWEFGGAMRHLGEMQWQYAVERWQECLASGVWPAYDEPAEIEPPGYAMAAAEAAQLRRARTTYFSGPDDEIFGEAAE